MAKKKKKVQKPPRELTRRQLAKWEQQQRRQRLIFIAGASVIGAVLLMILLGWFISDFLPLRQTVITVNGRHFNLGYYIDSLKIRGQGQQAQTLYSLADQVVTEIETMELTRGAAADLGVNITRDEIEEERARGSLPENQAALDAVRYNLTLNRLLDVHFEREVPKSAEQVHVMAMLLESEQQAADIRQQLVNGEDFTALAREFSLEPATSTREGDLGWHPAGVLPSMMGTGVVEDYAFGSPVGTLSQPRLDADIQKHVGYWLIKVLSWEDEEKTSAHVLAMALGSADEAEKVLARLENGEDFAALAGEFSQLPNAKDNGGDVGIIQEGQASTVFNDYVFGGEMALDVVSPALQDKTIATQGGYWLIKVVEKEDDREITREDRDLLKVQALDWWVAQLWTDPANQVESSLTTDQKDRAVKAVLNP
ncbi:MAG: peptidylprolyl isomerase [Chloroflexota bacterium]